MKQYLETGKIVGTHGVKGEMRVEPWCDSPDFLKKLKSLYFNEGRDKIELVSTRVHKRLLLITVKGVDSIEKADLLRGKIIYLNRDDVKLEQGQTFIADLIGLEVRDALTGKVYGDIVEVFPTGANDVYKIKSESGEEFLFPAVAHMIEEINPFEGFVSVKPIPGIFDDGAVVDEN